MRYKTVLLMAALLCAVAVRVPAGGVYTESIYLETDPLSPDELVRISRDASDNITLLDGVTTTKTLAELVAAGTPAGATTQVQYNNGGAFGGDANLVWDDIAAQLTVTGYVNATNATIAQYLFHQADTAFNTYLHFGEDMTSCTCGGVIMWEAVEDDTQNAFTVNPNGDDIDCLFMDATGNKALWVRASDGETSITANLDVGTTITARGDLVSTDDTIVGDDLTVAGLATVGETLAVTGNIESNGTTLTLDSAVSADVAVDRGAVTDRGVTAYQTAGTTKWATGLLGDSTDNYYIATGYLVGDRVLGIERSSLDVTLFGASAAGTTPEFKISGYRTADALRTLEIGVGVDAADTASFDGVGNYKFGGTVTIEANQPILSITDDDDVYPVTQLFGYAHDVAGLNLDTYWDGSGYNSSDAGSNFQIFKQSDVLQFRGNSGTAAGSNIAWSNSFSRLNINPGGLVDVPGTFNADGAATFGSTVVATGEVSIATTTLYATLGVQGDTRMGALSTSHTEVEADGDVNFVGGGGLQCGDIWTLDNVAETVITTANVYVQMLFFAEEGVSNGNITPRGITAGNDILVGEPGIYYISFSVCGIGSSPNDVFDFFVYTNNGATQHGNVHAHSKFLGAGALDNVSGAGLVNLSANDTVELWVANRSGTGNITIEDSSLVVMQVASFSY